jgi:sporulation-control protein spo0M
MNIQDILLVIHHNKAHNHLQVVVVLDGDHLHSITYVDVYKEGEVGWVMEYFKKDLEYEY